MRRGELSEDGVIWNIPGERTKNHRTHLVALSLQAREIIAFVPQAPGAFIFTTNGGRSPISGWSKAKAQLDKLMLAAAREEAEAAGRDQTQAGSPHWTIHDLRRPWARRMPRPCLHLGADARGPNPPARSD